jgi:hypothetical protein
VIALGNPPVLPGKEQRFDISGSMLLIIYRYFVVAVAFAFNPVLKSRPEISNRKVSAALEKVTLGHCNTRACLI